MARDRVALVTIVTGEKHTSLWRRHAEAGWRAWCARHDLDLIVIDQPIDTSPLGASRSVAWQKLLIHHAVPPDRYDRLIWMDADIVINPETAPDPRGACAANRIGAVAYDANLRAEGFALAYGRMRGEAITWPEANRRLLSAHGLHGDPSWLLNTGLLIVPTAFWPILEGVYRERTLIVSRQQQEQVFLSHEIGRRGIGQMIDPKFNFCWYEFQYMAGLDRMPDIPALNGVFARALLDQVYCLHFAGTHDAMNHLAEPA